MKTIILNEVSECVKYRKNVRGHVVSLPGGEGSCAKSKSDLFLGSNISSVRAYDSLCWLQSYPKFQDFIVVHDYLVTPNQKQQARVRRRGQNGDQFGRLSLLLMCYFTIQS